MKERDIKPGMKFGKLTFISEAAPKFYFSNGKKNRYRRGNFICDCGGKTASMISNIAAGKSMSCGCDRISKITKHGLYKTPTHNSWCWMIDRCRGNGAYAGKVTVCDKWKDSFLTFLADMGKRPSNKHQVDRVDNNGNYNPDNCRWATSHENMCNTSKSKRWLIKGTEYQSMREAAIANGVHSKTIMTWCNGQTVKGRFYPPRLDCRSVYRYPLKRQ